MIQKLYTYFNVNNIMYKLYIRIYITNLNIDVYVSIHIKVQPARP
jgi:hypothetical protein